MTGIGQLEKNSSFTPSEDLTDCFSAVAAPGLGIWGGGHLRDNTHLGGGKIEFHEISPRCQNF